MFSTAWIDALWRRKVKPTPFGEQNRKSAFNASGVAQIGPHRFVFIDNQDPSALFELTLDADSKEAERISRRTLSGLTEAQLRDPEGLCRVDGDDEMFLVVASSLCVAGGSACDGLVRVRYTSHGELRVEAMAGFRAWLLAHVPLLAASGQHEPDAGGVNIEGVAWDPHGALLFGVRGPADRARISVIRVPVDAARAAWTTVSLGTPTILTIGIPQSTGTPGIRDISYDGHNGQFLVLLGRSTSRGKEPFQLCSWDGDENVTRLDVAFHRSMKPEGVTACSDGRLLIVDDAGGYAVLDYPARQ
ncbi:hypothetical protein [Mycobacterium sp. NPDC050853]|uniref:hypothetical protein n=1 Tax=Mycobacterium sp. NPDC050853 TaxID=3155160 RepID=UPI00340A75EC